MKNQELFHPETSECCRPTRSDLLGGLLQNRRQFLSRFGQGMGAIGLATLLGPELAMRSEAASMSPLAVRKPHFKPKAKRILHIFAQGAPSHIDTFDPKPELTRIDGQMMKEFDGLAFASPFKFSKHGKSGLEISEVFPKLADHADELCVLRSMWTDAPDHVISTFMMSTGQGRLPRPSMGAWIVYGLGSENQNLPGYIALSPGAVPFGNQNLRSAFLPGACQGTLINTTQRDVEKLIENIRNHYVTSEEQRAQLDLVAKLNSRFKTDDAIEARIQSFELAFQMQVEATDAFDVSKETEAVRERYAADTAQGLQMLIARRLLERGVRVVQVWHQGWDHHTEIAKNLRNKAAECDQPLDALLTDLKQSGLLDDTLIVWGGEFGRMPRRQLPTGNIKLETPPGRDHNAKGFCAWLAGGGVKGGYAYGATDDFGYQAVENKIHVHDLHATILQLLGFDHEHLTYRYNGRDFRLTDVYGTVVKDIIA
jgi:hypothetical protein